MSKLFALLGLLKNYKGLVAAHTICSILGAVFTVLSLPIMGPVMEYFLDNNKVAQEITTQAPAITDVRDYAHYQIVNFVNAAPSKPMAVLRISSLIVILFFFKNLFIYLAMFFIAPVRNGMVRDMRSSIFSRILHLPMSYFSDEKKGDLMARMSSDVQEVEWSILGTLEKFVREPITIIGSLAYMLSVSAKLTAVVMITLLITGVVIALISRTLKRQSLDAQNTLGRIMVMVEETLGGLKVIKAFTAEKNRNLGFTKENNHYLKANTALLRRRDMASPLSEFLGVFAVCVLFAYGMTMVWNEEINSGVFLVYLLAFFHTINPAKAMAGMYYNFQKGAAALDRINHIVHSENKLVENGGNDSISSFDKEITIKDVSFRYAEGLPYVLNKVNVNIKKGKTVALVGASGSGKTTLGELILRFYDIQSGEIAIDGKDIRQLNLYDLRSLISLVNQEPVLFHTTVKENISFGTGISDIEKIKEAAKLANAHDFISAMPDGYDTITGDSGQKLSGGQKQRIAIARAILADSPIIILDEATSALDSESERLVQNALDVMMKDKTAIVIAHRLSTIQNADTIYVMKDGSVIESGTHEMLIGKEGEYAKFVQLQLV